MKIWEHTFETSKLKIKGKTSNMFWWRSHLSKLKKLYNADQIYLDRNEIVVYRKEVIGRWKTKRLDGVKV